LQKLIIVKKLTMHFDLSILQVTGLPAPLNDVPQGRHFLSGDFYMSEVKKHLTYDITEKGMIICEI
jgi:hypothetical protein